MSTTEDSPEGASGTEHDPDSQASTASMGGYNSALQEEVSQLRESTARVQARESRLREELQIAKDRIAFLESADGETLPSAPSWVVGGLRRALSRCQLAFNRFPDIDEELGNFEDALEAARDMIDEMSRLSGVRAPVDERLALLDEAELCLRELVDASVSLNKLRRAAKAVNDAEDELVRALEEDIEAPLRLGAASKSIKI